VRAAGDVGYGDVVAALDTAKGAGVDRIGLMFGQETSRSTRNP
jgi:biopolymer transport protein ExbD